MKLSEAIRLGAMLKPQGRGGLFPVKDGVATTCAMGAAFEASGEAIADWVETIENKLVAVDDGTPLTVEAKG